MPSVAESAPPLPTVWVVEDGEDYRATVQQLVHGQDDLTCPHAFGSGEELFAYLNQHFAPEVLLVDIGLPGMDGIEVVRRMRAISPATHIVVLTIHEDTDRIFDAVCSGASGYLLKTATLDTILESVREVLRGGAPMTPQIARRVLNMFAQMKAPRWDYSLTAKETEVLRELVSGKAKADIAKALFRSEHTVDTHLRNVYAKLHVHSASQAVAKALKERLVEE